MASIITDDNGRTRILFLHPDGRRMTLRLGKLKSKREANEYHANVEYLVSTIQNETPIDDDMHKWITGLPARIADRLIRVGLIPKEKGTVPRTLDSFATFYAEVG